MIELVIEGGKVIEARGLIPGLDIRVRVEKVTYHVVRYGDDISITEVED